MTHHDPFDATLAAWLDDAATAITPGGLHESAMRAARRAGQRPTWLVALRGGLDAGARDADRPAITRRRVLVVIGLLLLAAAIAIVGAGWRRDGDPPIGATNGRIMFAREQLGENPSAQAQYVTIRPDGTDPLPFMQADQCGQCTFWSPDGRRIMVPSVADPDRLGTAIIDPDGSNEVVVPFPDPTLYLGPGGWTPDGRIILEGFDPDDPARPEVGLYIANADGSGLRQLTSSSDGRTHGFPTASPDGRWIVFLAQDSAAPPVGAAAGDLFIVAIDGSGLRMVNPVGSNVIASAGIGRPADWSPDSRQLAYAATQGLGAARRSAVFVVDAAGGAPAWTSDDGTSIISLDWSPDGRWIAFWEGNAPDLDAPTWIATPDGKTVRQLMGSGTPVQGCCATFSPDGTLLLVQRFEVGGRDLWTMDLEGNLVERITNQPGAYIWYSWAPAP